MSDPKNSERLSGTVAVVSGAAGGLGSAICERVLREGGQTVCQDVDEAAVRRVAERLAATHGDNVMWWACDVTDSIAIERMYDAAGERFGTVNAVVANAGVNRTPGDGVAEGEAVGADPFGQLLRMSDAGWNRMLEIHLTGAFICARGLLRRVVPAQRPASLVFISSVAAVGPFGPVHYAAAKAGMNGLARCIAALGGPAAIRSNVICPGVIETPMAASIDSDYHERVRQTIPLRRFGVPEDIAAATAYLLSDESNFVTGQMISPSGGLILA